MTKHEQRDGLLNSSIAAHDWFHGIDVLARLKTWRNLVSTLTSRGGRVSYRHFTRTRSLRPPAQQEHRLLAEQIPEPPRRIEPQRTAPVVQRQRPLHPD